MRNSNPLVSVGLPTYNRGAQLRRAIESVLAQDYPNLELVISDNGSTDETEALCTEFSQKDSRVRYIRQAVNRGMAYNFRTVLEESRGEYFMWLGDDDWMDANLVSSCVRVLLEDPSQAIVSGMPKHCSTDGTVLYDGDCINLQQDSRKERVCDYLRQIHYDGAFYGLMRREQLLLNPMRNVLAGDWLLISSIVFTGKLTMLEDVHLYRTDEGASASREATVSLAGLPLIFARHVNLFYLNIAASFIYDILIANPDYKSASVGERLSVAYAAARVIRKRHIHFESPRVTARNALDRVRSKAIIRTRLKRAVKGGRRKIEALGKRSA
jgi:glycosyltransferase involved in cell wall biosynthesis